MTEKAIYPGSANQVVIELIGQQDRIHTISAASPLKD